MPATRLPGRPVHEVAALTLARLIGTNTSVVSAGRLRPVPYRRPPQLVSLEEWRRVLSLRDALVGVRPALLLGLGIVGVGLLLGCARPALVRESTMEVRAVHSAPSRTGGLAP